MNLVLVEEECVLGVLEVINYRFLSLVLRLRMRLGFCKELLEDVEKLVALQLFLYMMVSKGSALLLFSWYSSNSRK